MRGVKKVFALTAGLAAIVMFNNMDRPDQSRANHPFVPGEILIQPKAGISETALKSLLENNRAREIDKIPSINLRILRVPSHAEDRVVAALSNNPHIQFAEKNYLNPLNEIIPNDPNYSRAWHLPKIEATKAWMNSQGDGVIVAILDTGIQADHPDLAGKLVPGWNSASQNDDYSDIHGHGTLVAGTVGAATNNGVGVAAVAWNAMIMPIRITDRTDGWASSSDMARGLTWAADNGAHVANMSYQSWRWSATQSAARYLRSKGGVAFASAGNDGIDTGNSATPDITVVSATGSSDTRTSWSNFGQYVDLSAPGASIMTTRLGSSYGSASGTSFSAPIAAAVAALVIAANPGLSPEQIDEIMYASADDIGEAGWDPYYGHGRVNARRAVELAITYVPAPPNQDPIAIAEADHTQGEAPLTVNFSGLRSYDSDGQISAYEWTLGSTVLSRNASFSYSFNSAGSFRIGLTVTDNEGATASDEITISVTEPVVETVEMHLSHLSLSEQSSRNHRWARATARIVDAGGSPVNGAQVTIQFSGLANETTSGNTDSQGYIQIDSSKTRSSGTLTASVVGVSAVNYEYNPTLNTVSPEASIQLGSSSGNTDDGSTDDGSTDDGGGSGPPPGKGRNR